MRFGNWNIESVIGNGRDSDLVIFPYQVHDSVIVSADECVSHQTRADGIYTDSKVKPIGISTADCLPFALLADTKALALHVSRKTLIRGLVENIPAVMKPEEISQIYIGPHICEEHFTFEYIGDELKEFMEKFPESVMQKNGKIHVSLDNAVQKYIETWNLEHVPIYRDPRCTFEDTFLPSYRRTGMAIPGILTGIQKYV